MTVFKLRLYVSGKSSQSRRAIRNLREICDAHLTGVHDVQIIDVLEDPGIAEREKILATPTLVKNMPLPTVKIIGDLSDRDKVLFGLGLGRFAGMPVP